MPTEEIKVSGISGTTRAYRTGKENERWTIVVPKHLSNFLGLDDVPDDKIPILRFKDIVDETGKNTTKLYIDHLEDKIEKENE